MAYFRKRENGWEYRISYKAPDGSFKQKSKSGYRTKAEAIQAASQAEIELSEGIVADKEVTLVEYFEKWYKIHRAPSIKAGTLRHYAVTAAAIEKYFTTIKLKDITPSSYQAKLNEMGKHYRKTTLRLIHTKIRSCAKYAVMDRLIKINFADLAKVTSEIEPTPLDKKFLTQTEYLDLIKYTRENPYKYRQLQIYILAVTGMRVGESLGLTWDDIDFDKKQLSINKTWDIYNNTGFAPTKNQQSVRTVPLDNGTIELLQEYKTQKWQMNDYNRLFPANAHAYLNSRIKKLVGRSVHIHSLRHTYVSYLLANGIEVLTISKLIGHKDPTITLNTYSHLLAEKEILDFDKIKTLF
ncbi:site-specific integrase [Streptococcus canis]|uniref:site-specific integrase n=1 Tax=Streptococcus canis TaxID=1329 RepID=UPI0013D999CE|nr:site-specific integrase [Streptococcus canis]QKG73736.1 site-specific integrase [Streptococcus canis]